MISQEHGINETGAFMGGGKSELERINVFYTETKGKHQISINTLLQGVENYFFKPKWRLEVWSWPFTWQGWTSLPDRWWSISTKVQWIHFDLRSTADYSGQIISCSVTKELEIIGRKVILQKVLNYVTDHFDRFGRKQKVSRPRSSEFQISSMRNKSNNTHFDFSDCDCLSGFQMLHALGGGTGSGLGSLLISKMTDEYPSRLITNYSIFPSPIVCNSVVEPYNAILTLNHLIEYSRETYCMDNEALNGVLAKTLKLSKSSLKDLNYIVAMVIAGTTSCLRFPGLSNIDYRKIAVNMIPYPRYLRT